MNPFLLILEQLAGQILAQEGPIVIQDLQSVLNNALAPHGHTVAITPAPVSNPVTPPPPQS